MIKVLLIFLVPFFSVKSFGQKVDDLINAKEALRIESFLASDELKGRKPGTPEMETAAAFIGNEFKKSGLKYFEGLNTYKQSFTNIRVRFVSAEGNVDGKAITTNNIIAVTTDSLINVNDTSGFEKIVIGNTENLLTRANEILANKKNSIVFVNSFFVNDFNKLKRLKRETTKTNYSLVFVLNEAPTTTYNFTVKHQVISTQLFNVIGVIPGTSKKDEFVVFSGHYDHLGIGKPNAAGDSIFNGANDDAAGTTAVIMLANYYAKQKNNERTLIFVAFTAEESGGFGAQYFSQQLNPDKVMAMFNIEMIGTESKWGKNSAFITGFEKSNFGEILQKNLKGSGFKFEPDPYPKENLFYRSDNATLAALGVPAHTISTSKMDIEPNYHKQSDEVSSLDMNNMAEIIKSIAISSKTIVSGKDTPTRVEKIK